MPDEYARQETCRFVVVPVPYDATSTWQKGADRGPEAILDASAHVELYDIETDTEAYTAWIHTDAPLCVDGTPEALVEAVDRHTTAWLEAGKLPVVVGGEHTVSVGAAQAVARLAPGVTVLQLDAHTDLREEYERSRFNHACVMARIAETAPIVQVGIRSMDRSELAATDRSRIFFADGIRRSAGWMARADNLLGTDVYITLDVDVFDPAIMPSTGTPEPGGLWWYQVVDFLQMVTRRHRVVGFDVVELCPSAERAPDFLAAKLIYRIVSLILTGKS